MAKVVTCSMCEERPADVIGKWPGPVCSPCDRWLDGLGADLAEMEADDPELAEAGRKVEESARNLHRRLTN
jgi:hypothetical protein